MTLALSLCHNQIIARLSPARGGFSKSRSAVFRSFIRQSDQKKYKEEDEKKTFHLSSYNLVSSSCLKEKNKIPVVFAVISKLCHFNEGICRKNIAKGKEIWGLAIKQEGRRRGKRVKKSISLEYFAGKSGNFFVCLFSHRQTPTTNNAVRYLLLASQRVNNKYLRRRRKKCFFL
jgi:hypothetical protein